MKIPNVLIAALSVILPVALHAQDASVGAEELPLKIAVVGTTNYTDINLIQKNLKRSSLIADLSTTLSSRELYEFSGRYRGAPEAVIEEVAGLAQDRFSVESPKKIKQGAPLTITLRKIAP